LPHHSRRRSEYPTATTALYDRENEGMKKRDTVNVEVQEADM